MKKILLGVLGIVVMGLNGFSVEAYSLGEALDDAIDYSAYDDNGELAEKIRPVHLRGAYEEAELYGDERDVTDVLQIILNIVTGIAASIAVFFIVKAGAGMATSFNNTETIEKSKKSLGMAVVGLIVIMFAYVIIKTVISLTYSAQDRPSSAGNAITETVEE